MSKILLDTTALHNDYSEFDNNLITTIENTDSETIKTTYHNRKIAMNLIVTTLSNVNELNEGDDFYHIECGVNATELAKAFGKEAKRFNRLKSTKNYVNLILDNINENKNIKCYDNAPLILNHHENSQDHNVVLGQKVTEEDLFVVKTDSKTSHKSTWIYNRLLLLKFASWLEPKFELWIFEQIDKLLQNKIVRLATNDLQNLVDTLTPSVEKLQKIDNIKNGKNIKDINKRILKTDDFKGRSSPSQIFKRLRDMNLQGFLIPSSKAFVKDLAKEGFVTRRRKYANETINLYLIRPTSKKIGRIQGDSCILVSNMIINHYVNKYQ